jgi:predicted N-acetyltransferase YhbS
MLNLYLVPRGFVPASARRDMDPARQKKFFDAVAAAEKKYFGPEWGKKRLQVVSIATNAEYQGRGAGRALMQWGLDHATELNIPIILTASPLGKILYGNLGFQELGKVECEVEGDNGEKAWTVAMIWVPDGWEKPCN